MLWSQHLVWNCQMSLAVEVLLMYAKYSEFTKSSLLPRITPRKLMNFNEINIKNSSLSHQVMATLDVKTAKSEKGDNS